MKLSTYTDYALRTLTFLALKEEGLSTIAEISDAYGISRNHLMKVVQDLAQGGYVESIRGRGGGLRLGRPAELIRIGDVVRYTEQDMCIVECFAADAGPRGCKLAPACVLKTALGEALRAFLAVLDQYTLADLARPRLSLASLLAMPRPPAPAGA